MQAGRRVRQGAQVRRVVQAGRHASRHAGTQTDCPMMPEGRLTHRGSDQLKHKASRARADLQASMTVSSRALLAVPPSSTLSRLLTTPYLPPFNSASRLTSLEVRMGLPCTGALDTNQDGSPSATTYSCLTSWTAYPASTNSFWVSEMRTMSTFADAVLY